MLRTVGIVILALIVPWAVAALIFRRREGRRRAPVIDALGGSPLNELDLAALDLLKGNADRVSLLYWSERAFAWQAVLDVATVSTIPFSGLTAAAYDPTDGILILRQGLNHWLAWQVRARPAGDALVRQLLATIARAQPNVEKGQRVFDSLPQELRERLSPGEVRRTVGTDGESYGFSTSRPESRPAPPDDVENMARYLEDKVQRGEITPPPVISLPFGDLPKDLPTTPVVSWESCPQCGGRLVVVQRAADCDGCRLVWCDTGQEPTVIEEGPDAGQVRGTRPRVFFPSEVVSGEDKSPAAFLRAPRPDGTAWPLPYTAKP